MILPHNHDPWRRYVKQFETLYRRSLGGLNHPHVLGVINPSNERVFAHISLGAKADVDLAVAAAKRAFKTFSRQTSRVERLELLKRIVTG